MRDPLWMEGDDFANDLIGEPSDFFDEDEEVEDDPDRLHDGFFDD